MDLGSPISSVIPSAHGAVLGVLARTTEPLSGRRVASLTNGKVSQGRVNQVLSELTAAGIALREDRPPSKLYRLNRDHVAADGVLALTGMWDTLLSRIRAELEGWRSQPYAACLFGSAARGDAGPGSDIDILLVRDTTALSSDMIAASDADSQWEYRVAVLTDKVRQWSGNRCEVLELTTEELAGAVRRDDRLVSNLRRDAITLSGRDIRKLLRRRATAGSATA